MVSTQPDGRINLLVEDYVALIDNVSIRGIATNELPDVREYLESFERIPADKRHGIVQRPDLKRGSGAGDSPTVYIKFYTNCTDRNEGMVID